MTGLTAIGSTGFLPGFALAGVSTILTDADGLEREIRAREGVVIVEHALFDSLPDETRREFRAGLSPIVIPLGEEDSDEIERLRTMVRSTLGVDLLR